MEEMGSLWNYQESVEELKQKLLYTTIEYERLKLQADEHNRNYEDHVKHLLELLKMACKERDEAKDHLNKFLNRLMPFNSTELRPVLAQSQPESPLVLAIKANSSITESNSLSDTHNHNSHGSTPVDSFLDAVTSPELSSMNMADSSHMNLVNKTYVQEEYNGSMPTFVPKVDPADAVIDSLAHGKALPPKGKLVQAVKEAGPLLESLMIAGRLPEWKNPPPSQPLKIPPFSIKNCDAAKISNHKLAANSISAAQKPLPLATYPDMSRGSSQLCSVSMLSFGAACSDSGLGSGWQLSSAVKRQRFH